MRISEAAKQRICEYEWGGNVRQLKNFCERLVIVADEPELSAEFVEHQLFDVYMMGISGKRTKVVKRQKKEQRSEPQGILPLNEKEEIIWALNEAKGNRLKASELLGISKTSLWRKMKNYGITEQY